MNRSMVITLALMLIFIGCTEHEEELLSIIIVMPLDHSELSSANMTQFLSALDEIGFGDVDQWERQNVSAEQSKKNWNISGTRGIKLRLMLCIKSQTAEIQGRIFTGSDEGSSKFNKDNRTLVDTMDEVASLGNLTLDWDLAKFLHHYG